MEGEEPTQPTQPVLDPRRVGKQNTGFSDEDISDIICILHPHSDSARKEVQRLVEENSPFVIGKDAADSVEPNYDVEDHASQFGSDVHTRGNPAIMLRLSARPKNPAAGFAFGRNPGRCDVVFSHDPLRRVSNIHFRIYVNEFGNVMVEDQSTNGTYVDRKMLSARLKPGLPQQASRWVLTSGSVIEIYLHDRVCDLTFRVRIPRRDGHYERVYLQKVLEYFIRNRLPREGGMPPVNPPAADHVDHVDLFRTAGQPLQVRQQAQGKMPLPTTAEKTSEQGNAGDWTGSGKYNKIRSVGKGAFAVVYQVTAKYDGRPYAAKELEKRHFMKNGVLNQKVENEMRIMRRLNHPNIVRYIENFDWDERLFIIIMEFVAHGDLGKLISVNLSPLTESVTQELAVQLLSALRYLHNFNITHRDIKPDNILVSSVHPLQVKLTDFGLSKMIDSEQTFLRTFCGTLLYCAPEVYTEYAEYDERGFRVLGKPARRPTGQRYSHAVDIWSLGGVLFFCLAGAAPYPARTLTNATELLHRVMTTALNTAPLQRYGVSEVAINFIRRMLQRRPENRATIEELEKHMWLSVHAEVIQASQSFDDVTDDEELPLSAAQIPPSSQFPSSQFEYDRVSDSMDEDSDRENQENQTVLPGQSPPRLFGEVAFASSGVFPKDYFKISSGNGNANNLDEPIELVNEDDVQTKSLWDYSFMKEHANGTSVFHNQSTDQLQSLVAEVASQSLGGDDDKAKKNPLLERLTMSSVDPNTSKRKPPSAETSDEFDENTPPEKPTIKRFRSEGNEGVLVTEEMIEEYKLLACIEPIRSFGHIRPRDEPVMKAQFWTNDISTWHLDYPEMTELQLARFNDAVRHRNEFFLPNCTPLWALAMKYFPPTQRPDSQPTSGMALTASGSNLAYNSSLAATASSMSRDDSQATPVFPRRVVPVQTVDQMAAIIESDPSSCVRDISLPITEPMLSFGRGPENTRIYEDRMMVKVPKYAFRILLWRKGFDPGKFGPPWRPDRKTTEAESEEFFFWISTKATNGILVNDERLRSSSFRSPHDPSENWARLHDGDSIVIWHDLERTAGSELRLTFRCAWGGSARPRGGVGGGSSGSRGNSRLELASASTAEKLNAGCRRFERQRPANRQRRRDAVDLMERKRAVEAERRRNVVFEERRREAETYLAGGEGLPPWPRRHLLVPAWAKTEVKC